MAGMAGKFWKMLKTYGMTRNGWKCLEIAITGFNWLYIR